jgi:hypothetical protein
MMSNKGAEGVTTEGPTNDLLRRMLAAIAAASGHDHIDRLITQARADAEAEVKDLLKSAVKASLLREVVRHLEGAENDQPVDPCTPRPRNLPDVLPKPTAPEATSVATADSPDATACYVYAITDHDPRGLYSDTPAIDPSLPLDVVRYRSVQAVISRVRLDEFGQDALNQRVADRQWVEEKIRAHDRVVKRVCESAAAIPCRFCTVVRHPRDVQLLLSTHYQPILDTLDNLRGKQEWGMRILFDPSAHAPPPTPGASSETSGRQYLQRRKQKDSLRADLRRNAADTAQACHQSLAALAAQAALLPARRGEKRQPIELLNAAYLVPQLQAGQFERALLDLRNRHESEGLELLITGPWPPYNFVRLDLSLEAAA